MFIAVGFYIDVYFAMYFYFLRDVFFLVISLNVTNGMQETSTRYPDISISKINIKYTFS